MRKLLTVLCFAASLDAAPRWSAWGTINRIFPRFQMLETIVAGTAPGTGANTSRSLPNTNGNYLSNTTCYLSAATDFTIAFWMKAGNNTQASVYVLNIKGNGGEFDILYGYDAVTNMGIYADADGAYAPSLTNHAIFTIADTNWHHVAFRHSGATWSYFLDGSKTNISTSATFTLKTNTASCQLMLGRSASTSAKFLGSMGRLLISTSALTDGQIAALAGSACSSSGDLGVTGYWPLLGSTSPEPEASPSPNTNSLTMTGTVAQDTTGPTCSGQ